MGLMQDLRRSGIGGTDASAVLGLNPWRTPLQVWAEKRGAAPEVEQTPAMRWGLALEPVIADEYEHATGRKVYAPENVYHHPEYDFLLGSPDRLCLNERRGVEIKTASGFTAREWGPAGTDQVPQHYLIQCLHYMAVTGLRVWDVAVLIGGSDFRLYTIRWDEEAGRTLTERLVAWWQRHMVEGVEPAAMAADVEWLDRRYPRDVAPLLPISTEAAAWIVAYKDAKATVDEAAGRMESAKAALKQLIGGAAGVGDETCRVMWKANADRRAIDWEAVARELAQLAPAAMAMLPEVEARHTTTKPGARVFRLTEKESAR